MNDHSDKASRVRGSIAVHRMKGLDQAMREALTAASDAALPLESRWTLAALARVDRGIYDRLREQRALLDAAVVTGTQEEVIAHAQAMARGYRKAAEILERAAEPDDAYFVGQDPRSGLKVAIGHQKAAAARVRELHGHKVIWVTPDEVAAIVANLEAFKPIAMIKQMFPGAEMVDVYPGEPAKADGDIG